MIDLIVYPIAGVASFFLLKWLYNEIFGRDVAKPEPEPILDEDDYLMFNYLISPSKINYGRISRYYEGETVLKNKDMSLTVYVSLMTKSVLRVANTKEMYDRIVGKNKQLEEEVRALINLGVLKCVPVSEVPAFRHFLLDRNDPAKVIEFLRTEESHSYSHRGKSEDYIHVEGEGLVNNGTFSYIATNVVWEHNELGSYKRLQPDDKVFIKIKLL